MRGLLLRIFLWFWLAMVLIAGSTAAITSFIMDEMRGQQPGAVHREVANEAARALAKGGREGLTEWVRKRNSGSQRRVFVLTPENRDLLGRELPWFLRRQWEAPPQMPGDVPGAPNIRYRPQQTLPIIVGADGTPYRFIVLPARPSRWGVVGEPYTRWVLLIVAFIVTGGVSYVLARSITRPIDDLTQATQKLADGNLDVRTSEETLSRGDELARLGASFDTMAQRIRELLESRERLLRDISHELRSPLARMRVALGLVRQPGADAERQIDRLEAEAERLNGLIGQILAVSRLGAVGLELEQENIELGSLVDTIAHDAAYEAQAARKTIAWEMPAEMVQMRGNGHWLGSAIENVVRNALRHTPEGGEVSIELVRAPGEVIVRVRDHGSGVPDGELERIFEPFYRTASARERDSGGEGLGLAITSRVMKAHRGTVRARNAEGGGLEVELRIPIQ